MHVGLAWLVEGSVVHTDIGAPVMTQQALGRSE